MESSWAPTERGLWAWVVGAASFVSTGLCLGLVNSFGVFYAALQERLAANEIPEPSSKAALVGSLTMGVLFAFSPAAGLIAGAIGARKTTLLGGAVASIGVFASSYLIQEVELLYLTYGVLFGLGASLSYTPSLTILGLYLESEVNLVNGIVAVASATFTAILPHVLGLCIAAGGLEWTLRLVAGLLLSVVLAALTFVVPRESTLLLESNSSTASARSTLPLIWHNKKFLTWVSATVVALVGYYIPYVHLPKFVSINFPNHDGSVLITCIGVAFGVGRIVYGQVSNLIDANRLLLQQVSLVIVGGCCLALSAISEWYWAIALSLLMGLFDGCFISQIAPIAVELCGVQSAHQAVALYFAVCSVPIALGPPLAGYLFDRTGTYYLPFVLASAPLVSGGLALSFVKCC
ncbi:monocarboxylate transporter 10-like [Neocloeon triangulifer]|uniref:monocarboxylate transporter 10-like n=1 Tax=Neocloeon triangulifer TaxID=2078957 RepID=UPI00286ED120|nr:monocarboxylate transporter 10-like [Neocloeon triangulifer]